MNIDACVIGVIMARQSVMVNDVEDLGCVQQKQHPTLGPEHCPVERRRIHSRRWTDLRRRGTWVLPVMKGSMTILRRGCQMTHQDHLIQEGWLSPTERASVSAISLRHNLATSGESQRYGVAFTRFAGGGIWLPQESLRHILAPGTIAVNVTWMQRGFNACQTHRSMYPSIFNTFPVIQPVSSKVRHFSTFLPPLGTNLGQSQ